MTELTTSLTRVDGRFPVIDEIRTERLVGEVGWHVAPVPPRRPGLGMADYVTGIADAMLAAAGLHPTTEPWTLMSRREVCEMLTTTIGIEMAYGTPTMSPCRAHDLSLRCLEMSTRQAVFVASGRPIGCGPEWRWSSVTDHSFDMVVVGVGTTPGVAPSAAIFWVADDE